MVIFWVPFSRFYPDASWPTRAITLFKCVTFANGTILFAYYAIKAKTLRERLGASSLAMFMLAVCISFGFRGFIGYIASLVSWAIIAAVLVVALVSFVVTRWSLSRAKSRDEG
jgi:ABC-type multidrug transport system permease subunit